MSDELEARPEAQQSIELQPGIMAEVMTPENRLIYVGKVEKVQNGGVYIKEANDDTLPMVLVNKPVKVRFYREEGNLVLRGKVCGSTMRMWKVDRLEGTFTRAILDVPLVANAPTFAFNCQIRRADVWKKGVYRYGCQFEALAPRDQDRLLQAIFTIQREEIKKRKGR